MDKNELLELLKDAKRVIGWTDDSEDSELREINERLEQAIIKTEADNA